VLSWITLKLVKETDKAGPVVNMFYLNKKHEMVTKVTKGHLLRLHKSDGTNQSLMNKTTSNTDIRPCDNSRAPFLYDDDKNLLYVGCEAGIDVVDIDEFRVIASFECDGYVTAMSITPDKSKLFAEA